MCQIKRRLLEMRLGKKQEASSENEFGATRVKEMICIGIG